MTTLQAQAEAFRFGRFVLKPGRRMLLADGVPVPLSSRAYDILELLVRCHDRVVSRDELVAHVWRGTIVGDGNLTVQMSALRRALGEHAAGESLIVNLPGRGYRLVAEVSADSAPPVAAMPPPERQVRAGGPVARSRKAYFIAALLPIMLLPAAVALWHRQHRDEGSWSSLPESRLSIAMHRLVPFGDDPRAASMAALYTGLILGRLQQFEDLQLLLDPPAARPGSMPHFQLQGSVQVSGATTTLEIGLTEAGSGKLLYRNSVALATNAAVSEDAASTMDLLAEMRPLLFQAEADHRRGPPRDGLDFLIAADVALGRFRQISDVQRALPLAEAAVRLSPAARPPRFLLSLVLFDAMISSSARDGDGDGLRALALIDDVLRQRPRNCLYIRQRAYILIGLDRLDDARATVDLGLQVEPGDPDLTDTLGEILMLTGDLVAAKGLLRIDADDTQDDTLATIAFAERRYAEAFALSHRVVAATPDGFWTQFPLLLEVASLSRLGRVADARATLRSALGSIPEPLRSIGAQRRTTYVLSEEEWHRFIQGLSEAGMPP